MLQMRFRVVKNLPKLAQLKRDRARILAIWIQHAVLSNTRLYCSSSAEKWQLTLSLYIWEALWSGRDYRELQGLGFN